jgi:hypothetical protein
VRHRDERRIADLHHRSNHGPFHNFRGDLPGETGHLHADLRPVLDVLLEGHLAAVRAGDVGGRVDLGVAPAPPEQHQPGAGHRAELGRQPVRVGRRELADRVDPEPGQLRDRLGADPPDHVRWPVAEEFVPGARGQPEDPGGLAEASRDLGLELVLADPDRAVEPGRLLDAGRELAGEGLRVVRLDPDERLVPAEHLHRRAGVPQHLHDLGRHRQVGGRVDRQEDAVLAALLRGAQRLAGVHAECAGLVGGRGDHAALGRVSVAAHHQRPAAQLGMAQHLDSGDELVEIDMQHPAGHVSVVPR